MAYQGLFVPKNKEKYKGDPSKIVFRSSWERCLMEWLDNNPDVVEWSSEEFHIPYVCATDSKPHRYFPDFLVKYKSGKTVLIEVKPQSQVVKPKITKGKRTRTILNEAFTYKKNESKWKAAEEYCRHKGWTFQIWTEVALKAIGMKIK